MNNLKEYIDLMGEGCRTLRDDPNNVQKILEIKSKMNILWNYLTGEEREYADETFLRTRLYMGV